MPISNSDILDSVTQKWNQFDGRTVSYTSSAANPAYVDNTLTQMASPSHRIKDVKDTGYTMAFMDWMGNRHNDCMKFHEDFIGHELNPHLWQSSITGGGAIKLVPDIGGVVEINTGGIITNTCNLNLGNNIFLRKDYNFWVEFSFAYIGIGLSNSFTQFGVWSSATDYICFRRIGNALGVGVWHLDSMHGGALTTVNLAFDAMPITEYQTFALATNRPSPGTDGDLYAYRSGAEVTALPSAQVTGELMYPFFYLETTANERKQIWIDYVDVHQIHNGKKRPPVIGI